MKLCYVCTYIPHVMHCIGYTFILGHSSVNTILIRQTNVTFFREKIPIISPNRILYGKLSRNILGKQVLANLISSLPCYTIIRGQAPVSERGIDFEGPWRDLGGEPKESPSLRGGIRKFDQF